MITDDFDYDYEIKDYTVILSEFDLDKPKYCAKKISEELDSIALKEFYDELTILMKLK